MKRGPSFVGQETRKPKEAYAIQSEREL